MNCFSLCFSFTPATEIFLFFRALPGRRRGAGGLSDTLGTFTTTANASYGINSLLGAGNVGGKPRSAGINSDPAAGNEMGNHFFGDFGHLSTFCRSTCGWFGTEA